MPICSLGYVRSASRDMRAVRAAVQEEAREKVRIETEILASESQKKKREERDAKTREAKRVCREPSPMADEDDFVLQLAIEARRFCQKQCNCINETCNNQESDRFQDPYGARMDLDTLNAALTALGANQQQQQQQQQQQRTVLPSLAARLLAAPVPAPLPPAAPGTNVVHSPARVLVDPEERYSGSTGESVNDWLQLVNRKALAENWGNGDKRRVAISSLFVKAPTWKEEIGNNILDWDD
ncbi:uncharacterized protein LOC116936235 [Daphnia magna]|uniref:uncharacterized protein LOC116936235 n=1 Tax=Daphnia magna TaxID=35525 RepID=UPI001E1BD99B|nr:uncharacterized protein LOC116936235 [Daphnia magna]